jgi:hypothetical protein
MLLRVPRTVAGLASLVPVRNPDSGRRGSARRPAIDVTCDSPYRPRMRIPSLLLPVSLITAGMLGITQLLGPPMARHLG